MVKRDSFQNDTILTLSEIAKYLKISEKTTLKLVQTGEIPGAKISNQWRFMRDVVDDWLISKMQSVGKADLLNVISVAKDNISLLDLIGPGRILLDLSPGDKGSILKQMMQPLISEGIVKKPDAFLKSLLEREATVSTAVGHGIAVPHLRYPDGKNIQAPCMVIGRCRDGVDYDSLDGDPTYLFILPCSPSETIHLKIIARLSLMFRLPGIVDRFRGAQTAKQVVRLLQDADKEVSG